MIERLSRVECVPGSQLLPSTLTSPDQDTFAWDDAVAGDLTVKRPRADPEILDSDMCVTLAYQLCKSFLNSTTSNN